MVWLEKLFWSKCRKSILEKFFLEHRFHQKTGFFIREVARDTWEQLNNVRRELANLENIGILRSHTDKNKKTYTLDMRCSYINELGLIFLMNFDPVTRLKEYFKGMRKMSLLVVGDGLEDMMRDTTNNLIDILIIGDIDKSDFSLFLEKHFFGRKIKYAVVSEDDFYNRIKFGDKLLTTILSQPGNKVVKDSLKIKDALPALRSEPRKDRPLVLRKKR